MLPLRIAARYLLARKSHNAVNVISLVALSAVAVATAAMVCVLSVFNGFRDITSSRLSLLNPELAVTPDRGKVIDRADSLAAVITAIPGVAAASPVLTEQGLAIYGDRQMHVALMGVAPEWKNMNAIDSTIIDGETLYGAAWLSAGVAVRLGARPDPYRNIAIYTPRRIGRINPAAPMTAFRADSLMVSAVWQSGQSEFDTDRIILPLGILRSLLSYSGGEASRIDVAITPGSDASVTADRISRATGLPVATRIEQQAAAFKMIEIEKWLTFVMLAFILIIASFNIISSLSMLIIEKRESTFILSAMGMSRRIIDSIFVIQGWLISLVGGLAGIVIGTALTLAQQWGGFIKLGGDHSQMSVTSYPVALEPTDLLAVIAVVAAVGTLTGLVTLFTRK